MPLPPPLDAHRPLGARFRTPVLIARRAWQDPSIDFALVDDRGSVMNTIGSCVLSLFDLHEREWIDVWMALQDIDAAGDTFDTHVEVRRASPSPSPTTTTASPVFIAVPLLCRTRMRPRPSTALRPRPRPHTPHR